jgi:pimeloyl-ACP methyl ester carboxylesterase
MWNAGLAVAFFKSSDGVRLAYRIEGSGPALLLHLGAGCDSELWEAAGLLDPLAHSYTCVLFDHRGHGESGTPRGSDAYHLDRLTGDVVELLDHVGIEQVAFWGYSMGISPGVRLAQTHPGRVWALVASGVVGPPGSPEETADSVNKAAAGYREHGWEQLIAGFEKQEPDPIPGWMTERIRATDIGQFIDTILSIPSWDGWEEWDVLPTLATPTLFLTGELEDPDDNVGRIVARMPRGEVERLSGLGHINAFLARDRVLPRVQRFLAAHAPSEAPARTHR